MEKPFGTDLDSAIELNDQVHETFSREPDLPDRPLPRQGGGAEHPGVPVRQRAVRADLEPQLHRPHPDRHPRDPRPRPAGRLLRGDRRLQGHGRHPPVPGAWRSSRWSRRPPWSRGPSARRRTRSSARCCRSRRTTSSAGSTPATASEEGVSAESDTETFIALKARDRQLALGRRAVLPAHRQEDGRGPADHLDRLQGGAEERCSRRVPASAPQGPDHLTFDLADESKVSLSFYGKRPGPGMRLDKLSMQFSTHETDRAGDVLEAYERLILDAMRGDHTLFTTAEGIESLWERSIPLLDDPPPVKPYAPGTLGPERHPPADRAARLAAAVRAGLAREEVARQPVAPVDSGFEGARCRPARRRSSCRRRGRCGPPSRRPGSGAARGSRPGSGAVTVGTPRRTRTAMEQGVAGEHGTERGHVEADGARRVPRRCSTCSSSPATGSTSPSVRSRLHRQPG